METKTIYGFDGEYSFLSNFYPCKIVYDGLPYNSSEAAFQAQKLECAAARGTFRDLTPGQAKKRGRQVALRPGWEEMKDAVMHNVVLEKFCQNPDICEKLLDTGDAILIEGNTWGDTYWGQVNGVGKNMLGEILMRVRAELAF